MKKLYIYNEKKKCFFYDEAWVSDNEIIEHIGQVGKQGRTISHNVENSISDEENIENVLQPGINGGYQEIDLDDHYRLIVEYKIDGFGSPGDIEKRHALEDLLNETLGWTGLGHCDGGSIGSNTMEVCCFVVDYSVAKEVITKELKGTEFDDYNRIYDEEKS